MILFVFKAGISLPLTAVEIEYVQSHIELQDQDSEKSCCDHDDNTSDKGCCQSGICCCISIGGFTMTFQDLTFLAENPISLNDAFFGYVFLYKENIDISVFQPPQLG